jgi:predicted MFS family arabinose efflux permease
MTRHTAEHHASPPGRAALRAALLISVFSMAAFLALPMFIAAVAAHYQLDDAAIGWLGSAVGTGTAISSAGMLFLVRRVAWIRLGQGAFLLLLGGMVASLLAPSWPLFVLCQCVAAIGGGAAYSLALTVLSDAPEADRWFGYSVAAQVAFQVAAMLAGPTLVAAGGLPAVIGAFAVVYLAGLLLASRLPVEGRRAPVAVTASPRGALPATLLALLGCFLFFFNVGVVWTYLAPLAQAAAFDADAIGNGLAIGVAFGVPGALLAAWCGDRYSRIAMIGLGAAATVLALWLLRGTPTFSAFVVAAAIYNLAWNFSLAFQYAAVNAVDASGRAVAVAPAFHGAGAAVGPAAGALLVDSHGLAVVLLIGAAAVVLSALLFAAGARLHAPHITVPAQEGSA